jgi:hypothetical protein
MTAIPRTRATSLLSSGHHNPRAPYAEGAVRPRPTWRYGRRGVLDASRRAFMR